MTALMIWSGATLAGCYVAWAVGGFVSLACWCAGMLGGWTLGLLAGDE